MKILLVSEDIPSAAGMGGLAKHVLLLARALGQAGHEVDLMGSGDYVFDANDPELALPGRFLPRLHGAHAGWKEHALGCYLPPKRWAIARRFARAILREAGNYDVVHYHGHCPDIGAFIPANVNFVQTRHDQGADCLTHTRFRDGDICRETDPAGCAGCATLSPNMLQRGVSTLAVRHYRSRVRQAFARHKTIFVSDMLRTNLCRTFGGQPGDWGRVVHNFLDAGEVGRVPPVRADASGRNVFVAGKLYSPKGIDAFLAEMAPRLPAGMRITVAGNGPQEEMLRDRHAGQGISFLGWCDLPTVLNHAADADFIVVPSLCEEAFGSTTLEGLALGKPVYALMRGGTPELARYERFAGQLRLFDSMSELATSLAAAAPCPSLPARAVFGGDVRFRLPEILAIYHQPLKADDT